MTGRFFLSAIGAALVAAGAQAQYVKVDPTTPGYGQDVFYGAAFDNSTVITLKAKVRGVSTTPADKAGQAADVALLVSPFEMAPDRYGKQRMVFLDGYVNVELGPSWFVNAQTLKLHPNDYVEIIGSRMRMGDETVIIAQTVRRGHQVLALHRLTGEPYWYAFKPEPKAQPTKAEEPTTKPETPVDEPTPPNPWLGNRFGNTTFIGPYMPLTFGTTPFGMMMANSMRPLTPLGGSSLIILSY